MLSRMLRGEAEDYEVKRLALSFAHIKSFRWWSLRWLWWFFTPPKPPSLYLDDDARPDRRTWFIQMNKWLDKEPN